MSATVLSETDPAGLRQYLLGCAMQGASEVVKRDLAHYLDYAFQRYVVTLEFLPRSSGSVLELGAAPYHITLLMKHLRDYRLELANFFGESDQQVHANLVIDESGRQYDFSYRNFNVETERFPYPDAAFDGVLFCELLEHMTNDPVAALREIHRVLKPGGWLVLTTPNINRYENIIRLARGWNIVDQYSGYGPYGRHNREYSLNEVESLLQTQGFDIERLESRPMLPPVSDAALEPFLPLLGPRSVYEDNIFCLARRADREPGKLPNWLYRSYPLEEIDPVAAPRDFVGPMAPPPDSLPALRERLRIAEEENARHRLVLRTRIVKSALRIQRLLARMRGKR